MFNVRVLKRPSRTVSGVLSVFTKTINELETVAAEHDAYAAAQKEVATAAQQAADEALVESQLARENIGALNKALGR